ncbi:hypothetical protein DE146DRAFT_668431 [Phaeosphaeria sp. MPI-PUGE-AT-0046c]|nr:hypothetical protein DE146DRAFT_668431 [Phaeosphaeria sp. MPI-PUGE-AT-0046c]
MLLRHFKRLCITSATLIAASPLATVAPKSSSLPTALQKSVPQCAQSCLQASLAAKFPVACSGQETIQCLCSRYSNSGESLGEVALGCVYSACSVDDPMGAAAYNVCLGQKDAVMPTNRVLTVVASNTPRTASTSSPTSKPIATPVITTTLRTQTTSIQSVIVDSISSLPLATSTPSSTPAAALPITKEEPPKMTPAQIAGLSVAAVAAFVIMVGLMALSVCLRRRKERRNAVFDSDEKGARRKSKKYSPRFSHYVAVDGAPTPPKRFPMALPPVARRGGRNSRSSVAGPTVALQPTRPVQRNGVGTSNSSSNTSLPLEQIGVAISAELDGSSAPPRVPAKTSLQVPFRPVSTMTQDTVFEEDEIAARRRSSVLLPTPPVPVPPIRSLQPSQRAATFDSAVGSSTPHTNTTRQRRSELFLNIPVRHERPQPRRIMPAQVASEGSPQRFEMPKHVKVPQAHRLEVPTRRVLTSSPQRTPGSSNTGDIDDYYFTAHKDSTAREIASRTHLRDSPNAGQIKSKKSGSTASRTASRASTNFRDSVSSQTSFETADPSDPTPEDEDDDKQLSDDSKLSPVAESPISKLRYPKVPRASNQLVPRSPRSPQNVPKLNSPRSHLTPRRNQPSPPLASHLLQNRRKDLAPPLLETRLPLRLNAPRDIALVPQPQLQDPFTSPPRNRVHARSNSTESWSTIPRSKLDRKSRTQSGMWPSSPAMYDEIRPLNVKRKDEPLKVRRNRDEMKEINVGRDVDHDAEMNGLKSPIWVPRLTPTRKGEDLFISVGWGGR